MDELNPIQSLPEQTENNENKVKKERKRKERKDRAQKMKSVGFQMNTDATQLDETTKSVKKNRRRTRPKKISATQEDNGEGLLTALYLNGSITPMYSVTEDLGNLILSANNSNESTPKVKRDKHGSLNITELQSPNSKLDAKIHLSKTYTPKAIKLAGPSSDKKKGSLKSPKVKGNNAEKESVEPFVDYLTSEEVEKGLETDELFCGYIRINPKDFKLSYVTNPIQQEQDVVIETLHERNRALEGDKVVVKLKNESEWRSPTNKTGIVVAIKQQIHPRTAVGYLKLMFDKNKEFASFHPRDSRIPRIKIPFTDWPTLFFEQAADYAKVLFLAKITEWTDPKFAIGTITENIGMSGDIKVETNAILVENCLNVEPYSEEMKRYFPNNCKIKPEEYETRLDLRKECIFTIDPLTARDLDDAVSCKTLPNGNLEIGVHIADVTYYLAEGTPLDEIVQEKATSVYMVQSVYHMLPKELCMICSLLPGQDKLAFSVIWEMTPDGQIVNHKFTRTIINSCVQLAYEHAQSMIEEPTKTFTNTELPEIHNGYSETDISRTVIQLQQIALVLRKQRFDNGALRIDQPKICFSIDPETCLPISYRIYEIKDCHRLIEEFMLLANVTVATRIKTDYPEIAFLRSHPVPHEHMMTNLKTTLEKVGIHLDVSSAGGLQQTLWKYAGDDYLSQARMMVLSVLCAKPMCRAHYFCAANSEDRDEYWHYALSVPLYTHFTSPIRRYADIMVHRLLAASLGYTEKPTWVIDDVIGIAANCNKQKFNAKRADEQSLELYLMHYVVANQPILENAVVIDVKDSSFDAIVIANGLTVRIYLKNLQDNIQYKCLWDENDEGKKLYNLLLQWPPMGGKASFRQCIAIFSVVTVSLSKKDKIQKLDAKLVRPESQLVLF